MRVLSSTTQAPNATVQSQLSGSRSQCFWLLLNIHPLEVVALGAGFVYAVSLYGHRRSQLQALQRSETIELCESVSQCEPVRRPSGRRGRCWRQPPLGIATQLN